MRRNEFGRRKSKNRPGVNAAATRAAGHIVEPLETRLFLSNVPFAAKTALSTSALHAHSTFIVDLDKDGDNDVVTASQNDNTIAWFENNGHGSFTRHVISTTATQARTVYAIDLDKDGDIDVLSASENGNLTWYENNGHQVFTAHNLTTGSPGVEAVSAADFNGDGKIDIVADNKTADSLVWYQNDGSQNFTPHTIATGAGLIKGIYTVDLDGSGSVDILTASQTSNQIVWYQNNGSGAFTAHTIDGSANQSFSVVAADLNGDGHMDVVAASLGDNSVQWYENDGNQNFTKHVLSTSASGAIGVFVSDLDGDGDPDVLAANFSGNSVIWFENQGAGSFTEHDIKTGVNQATSVAAGDLDGDGDPDVVFTSFKDNTIGWSANTGGRLKVDATAAAPATIGNGFAAEALKLSVQHIGQTGDDADRLASLRVRFISAADTTSLSSAEASALMQSVSIYRDANGNGAFDAASDTLVASTTSLALDGAGGQTFVFGLTDANAQFGPGAAATLFVVPLLTADAAAQSPNAFRVVAAEATAADRVSGRQLVSVAGTAATTGVVTATTDTTPPSPPVSPPVSPPPPPATSGTLSATATGVFPAAAVAGQKVKATVLLTVTNTSGAVFNGRVGINLYASADDTLDSSDLLALPTSAKLKLKLNQAKVVKLKIRAFPAALTDGDYHLLAQIVPPTGDALVAATDATTAVAAPFVNLAISNVGPAAVEIGKKGKLSALVINEGNVAGSGTASILVQVVAVGGALPDALTLLTIPVKLKLKAGKSKKLSLKFVVPADLAAGRYNFIATIVPGTLPDSDATDDVSVSASPTTVS